MNLSDIPIEQLLKDKAGAEKTLKFSREMWNRGIRKVDGANLKTLITTDEWVLSIIDAELQRRGNVQPVAGAEGQGEE